jgi:ribosomal protein S2
MIKFLRVNNKKKLNTTSLLVPELIKSKIYLGLDKTILNSNSRGYLKGIRNKIYVFNALQIAKNLQRALRVIYNSHSSKLVVTNNHRLKMEPTKRILFLGFPETKKIE